MISRVYLKNCLSFDRVDLEFSNGLNIFTGPSGAGKSIFMQELLALFALNDIKSDLAEVNLSNSKFENSEYDIALGEDIVIKSIKKDKTRYFLNNQSISKKALQELSSSLIKYLSLKDTSDFKSETLINFLDRLSLKNSKDFEKILENFKTNYKDLTDVKNKLNELLQQEKNLEELKEFAKFEIEKIDEINPKNSEYEELLTLKKALSKRDKIEQLTKKASGIFDYSSSVVELLNILEVDTAFFDETMNELNSVFENSNDTLRELDDIDIEETLNRIEKISGLIKRFGSIAECLEYKEQKIKELKSYENITFQKDELEKRYKTLSIEVENLAKELSKHRKVSAEILQNRVNDYLKFLYLNSATIVLEEKELDSLGFDEIKFELNGVSLQTISSGEYNRLRLALLSAVSEFDIGENGILFLDEIDANLSGKESESISKVLIKLSKNYQIFAISHQVQLTSVANNHFLVEKKDGVSNIRVLKNNEKVEELARMVSGEKVTNEALEFAKNLLK